MGSKDIFHEAKEALDVAEQRYTSVGSLNVIAANAVNQACENSLRALYEAATGMPFPYERFRPFHKPELIANSLGITRFYSEKSQNFLKRLTGYALDDARFEGSQAYIDHTKGTSAGRSNQLIIDGKTFLLESEKLSTDIEVIKTIQSQAAQNDRITGHDDSAK